ncbi:DNA polymerase [Micromonospora sp. Llam0]|nr:UdgX family uracil-DNA binding protein [Micromonospora sp. Llam0]ROO58875.1 DNA polymerase [Micromonospora sp. Llam0]
MTVHETTVGAAGYVPTGARSLADLRAAAPGCQGCELHQPASQVVFGRGNPDARVVMVGEQPGDVEDRQGLPFVGPAGRLLRRAVDDAGIPVDQIYLTNAVKHFRFVSRGGRRIHQTPDRVHIVACRPWLVAEFAMLRPDVVVVLGATAARALLGPAFRVTRSRGVPLPWPASAERAEEFPVGPAQLVATIHPSAVLRADDQQIAFRGLVTDLGVVRGLLAGRGSQAPAVRR